MKVSLLPENEKERLEELRSYQIMDSKPEQDFDDLVELASQLCDSPIALITLIDENRQWIKAKIGVDISETTRDIAFCAHAIHDNDIMIIRDATQDDRFFDNPLVAEDPKVRFYAGMPLITDKGFKLGTLCVFDQKPKDLSDLQLNALRILGKQVVNLLDLRVRNLELKKQVQEKTTEIKDAFARDIIERKHNEESLQEAEVRYRTIFDNSIDGIYQTTPEGRFMLVNPALAKIFGYASPEEIINAVSDIGAQLYADPQDRLNQKILLAKDGKAMGSEFRVFKKNKEIIWVHDNIRAVYNSKGRIQYFEGTLKDITDRKEAEEKQRQAEQRYSMVVASMAEGMILFDQDGVMTDCNASAEKILSITAAQMKGQATNPSWKATGEDGSPITINNYPALVALGTGEEQRGKIMKLDKADGSFLWLSINALPIFDGENPKPTGVFATFIDITERKKAERVILESKEALERSEEQAKLGSWYVEVATGKRYWSKQLFRTFELDPLSEIPSFEDNLKRYHPDDRSLLKAAFEKVLRDEECEPIIIRTNPVLLPLRYLLHSWLCHRDAAGQPVKFEGTVLDITERKEAEENYRNIFENSLDGIYQTTPDGKLIIANPSTAKILGYVSVEELMASISDVGTQLYADPQDRDKMRDLLAQKGKVLGFEFKALNKGKEVIWLRANTQAICDEQGKIKHYEGSLRDITDRKEVEAQLIKEKDLAHSIINGLPGVFYLFNSVGKYLRWNKNFETITGYTGEEIANLHPSEFFEEGEERDRVVARIGEVFTKGFAEVETNFFTKDKRKIPYYFNGWKIEYENQTCLIGVGIDIAHRKKAVDELRESEIYLRGILDSTTDGILAIDTNGKVISSNNRFKELWHIPEELMALKDDHALLTYVLGQLVDPEEFLRKVEDLYRSDRTDFDILQFKDGRIFERQYNPLVLNKNKVGKVWSFRDATERKKIEKKLHDSENKLRAFFRSTPDASALLGQHFEVLAFSNSANELAENTYGKGLNEGDIFMDLVFPEVRPVIAKFLSKALLGETNQGEFPIPNIKTGRSIWWRSVFMPAYDGDGNILGVVANSTNINELKRGEIKLRKQFEELQKTNQELDRFVYSVSHDLRAPLASVLGLINVAEMESPSPSFKNYLVLMRSSINRLDGFIKDILDYSRNSRMDVQLERINFHKLIGEIQNNFKLINGAERLKIDVVIEDAVIFYSDRKRIEILLNNLLSNSIKYQDFQKEASIVFIHIVVSAEKAWIKFSDNGIGIEKKHLDKIFDMFYRASENSKGSGLGLYIAKETIAKLGGTLKVESEFGLSTTFEMTMPNSIPKG